MNDVGATFLSALGARTGGAGTADEALTARLDSLIRDAHAEAAGIWAPVRLPVEDYARHLAGAVAGIPARADLVGALACLQLHDLYLACAAGRGDGEAQARFATRFLAAIAGAVLPIDPSPGFADEVRQVLHERLLLGGDGPPRILQYGGRASLSSWVSVAARRAALDLVRDGQTHRRVAERAAEEPLPIDLDPELEFLKTRYRPAFKAAVSAALARLPARERTIIRLHTVGGLTLARIATMLAVDESTVSRWEKRARAAILAETQRELGTQLGVKVQELPSLARLVTSQLDVSVARLLGADAAHGAVKASR